MNEMVGNNLRKYRQAYGYTLEELAERVHKSRSTLSKYEKGLISIDVDTIAEFSAIFHIPAAQLLSVPCKPAVSIRFRWKTKKDHEKHPRRIPFLRC